MKGRRDPVGAEEDADDRQAREVAAELGQDDVGAGSLPRLAEDRAAGQQLLADALQPLPEDPAEQGEQDDRADRDQDDQPLVVGEEAELDREGAADREEEVEVDGDVEDREGDLLRRPSPESIVVKVAPANSVVNMISITQVPMLAGRKPFIATAAA